MTAGILLAGLLTLATTVILGLILLPRLRATRLARIRNNTNPEHWDGLLRQRMPQYNRMTPAVRERLLDQMQAFLHEKRFIGCNGLAVTEEMRVIVAAWAGLMSLGARVPYPALRSILIYPEAFLVDKEHQDEAGVVTAGRQALIGESWEHGKVVLSWADIVADFSARNRRSNVIVHEFAHQLDALDGAMAGSPPLGNAAAHKAWAVVFTEEYDRLRARHLSSNRSPGVLDPYGASDPAEFFAVAAESFFETPDALYRDHRELYQNLSRYFGVDPREWLAGTSAEREYRS